MSEGSLRSSGEMAEDELKGVLGCFPSGVVAVTAQHRGVPVGLTLQAFCALSLEPPLVLLCPSEGSRSWPKIEAEGRLCVNVLAEDQEDLSRQFAASGTDKFAGVDWEPSVVTRSPKLRGAIAWIDCEVEKVLEGGDHYVVTAGIVDVERGRDVSALVFFQSNYGRWAGLGAEDGSSK